jgi:hypothetical protein
MVIKDGLPSGIPSDLRGRGAATPQDTSDLIQLLDVMGLLLFEYPPFVVVKTCINYTDETQSNLIQFLNADRLNLQAFALVAHSV